LTLILLFMTSSGLKFDCVTGRAGTGGSICILNLLSLSALAASSNPIVAILLRGF
jgi:hypothetical protein